MKDGKYLGPFDGKFLAGNAEGFFHSSRCCCSGCAGAEFSGRAELQLSARVTLLCGPGFDASTRQVVVCHAREGLCPVVLRVLPNASEDLEPGPHLPLCVSEARAGLALLSGPPPRSDWSLG